MKFFMRTKTQLLKKHNDEQSTYTKNTPEDNQHSSQDAVNGVVKYSSKNTIAKHTVAPNAKNMLTKNKKQYSLTNTGDNIIKKNV